jgi:hypothetical protein
VECEQGQKARELFQPKCLCGGVVWWTCMQNLGAWKMLGECSTRISMNNLLSLE